MESKNRNLTVYTNHYKTELHLLFMHAWLQKQKQKKNIYKGYEKDKHTQLAKAKTKYTTT